MLEEEKTRQTGLIIEVVMIFIFFSPSAIKQDVCRMKQDLVAVREDVQNRKQELVSAISAYDQSTQTIIALEAAKKNLIDENDCIQREVASVI